MKNTVLYMNSFRTSIGNIAVVSSESEILSVALPNETETDLLARLRNRYQETTIARGGNLNAEAERQLRAYLDGSLTEFALPCNLDSCPPFHRKALMEVALIPYGQTRSYGEIAARIGHPNAFRAVGSANAHNPIPLIIPCHRVVARSGLGGFGGGLPLKKQLLALEQAHVSVIHP